MAKTQKTSVVEPENGKSDDVRYSIVPHMRMVMRAGVEGPVQQQEGWLIAHATDRGTQYAGRAMAWQYQPVVSNAFETHEEAQGVLATHLKMTQAAIPQVYILSNRLIEVPCAPADDVSLELRINSRLSLQATRALISINRAHSQLSGERKDLSTTVRWILEQLV